MAKVKYNGPKNVNRVVGDLVWNKENNHTVDVKDAKVVKMLLEQPDGEFTLADDEKTAEVKTNS